MTSLLNTPTHSDVFDFISLLQDQSIQTVVTSPPYFGLRNYKIADRIWGGKPKCDHVWEGEFRPPTKVGHIGYEDPKWNKVIQKAEKTDYSQFCRECFAWKGGLGGEPFPELFISHLADIFDAMKEKMHPTATLWVNLGDSYARAGGSWGITDAKGDKLLNARIAGRNPTEKPPFMDFATDLNYKKKDLIGVPWMFAFEMRNRGWWLRQDIIWSKPNPMPEPVKDRCTTSHEYIFLFSKSYKYFYDHYSILERHNSDAGVTKYGTTGMQGGNNKKHSGNEYDATLLPGRNKRDVWIIPAGGKLPRELSGQHFAAYPEAIPEICILAGTPHKVCAGCRAPYVRIVEKRRPEGWKDKGEQSELREMSKEIYGGNQKSRSVSDIFGRATQSERIQKGFVAWDQNKNWKKNLEKKWEQMGEEGLGAGDGDIYPQNSVYYETKKTLGFSPWDEWKKSSGADSKGEYKGKSRGDPKSADAQSPSDVKRNILKGMVPKESKFISVCKCGSSDTVPAIVFDPFMGTFTTAVVAERLGRDWVGCDVAERFVELGKKRLKIQVRKSVPMKQMEWM